MTDSNSPSLPGADPNNPVPLKQNINIVALAGALIALLVAYGVPMTADQKTAILGFLALGVPALLAVIHTFWNHGANKEAAQRAIRSAILRARGSASSIALLAVMVGTLMLGGCVSGASPATEIATVQTAFNTALTIYNGICDVNASANFCTAADMATAASLEKAINDALSLAEAAVQAESSTGGIGSIFTSSNVDTDIQSAVNAVNNFENFVNNLQAAKAAKLAARAKLSP